MYFIAPFQNLTRGRGTVKKSSEYRELRKNKRLNHGKGFELFRNLWRQFKEPGVGAFLGIDADADAAVAHRAVAEVAVLLFVVVDTRVDAAAVELDANELASALVAFLGR
jgi:hypothetical protein